MINFKNIFKKKQKVVKLIKLENLRVISYPNNLLRKKSKEVKKITEEDRVLIKNMINTIIKQKALGLSAPQIGILKRIIVVATKKYYLALINPVITKKEGKQDFEKEGCLSLPNVYVNIPRYKEIIVEALDIKGIKKVIRVKGLTSRIIQHEINHLDGILIIDYNKKFKR